MKLLFDQNISYRIVNKFNKFFDDCKQVTSIGLANCTDIEIWKYAHDNGYAIVTFDADFYEISLLNGCPPKIIWLRTGNMPTNTPAELLIEKRELILYFLNSEDENSCLAVDCMDD